ncbi:polysaccharide deacetylase family protein [Salinibacillus xinjiangensis]|uniref:Polysaccharide deacetylase family protein n=1 Tax=Salinibacillus xinjiangensis TaxID=1229268 RepID=A0A6G1X374_9BACI|nr:polysaccharide deacetylase family protein [Salinibacillus xinjiangensis]MRG85350.1 polysaccharide deacetylase family protein [Salinibacillus xinjiangensis]
MKRRYIIQGILFIGLAFLSFGVFENPFSDDYVSVMKSTTISKVNKDDPLYLEIKQKATEYEKEPKNAKIDDVWKKMPGINGLKVNVDKSYINMKKKGKFDEKLLAFKEIEPEVKFTDLPAAPVYRGHPEKKMVSYLINVSWGEEYIPGMLKKLKEQNVKATFFIDGKWAQNNVDMLKMIAEEGHQIGSHGYNHPNMSKLSEGQIKEQITKTNEIIQSILKEKPEYLAPPAGNFNKQVVKIAAENKMETIMWTIDTIDWQKPEKSVVLNRVLSKLEGGAMILMHPTKVMEESIDELTLKIKEKNYKIGTVGKLLTEKR